MMMCLLKLYDTVANGVKADQNAISGTVRYDVLFDQACHQLFRVNTIWRSQIILVLVTSILMSLSFATDRPEHSVLIRVNMTIFTASIWTGRSEQTV